MMQVIGTALFAKGVMLARRSRDLEVSISGGPFIHLSTSASFLSWHLNRIYTLSPFI